MKRKVWLLTAAALWIISAAALGGCSAYHKIEEETSGPKVEVVESQTEQEEGPTLAPEYRRTGDGSFSGGGGRGHI